MSLLKTIVVATGLFLAPIAAFAGNKTVTLKVDGMSCASCPYQVQNALKRVSGVKTATASLERREAVVVFDDATTTVAALTKATTDAGFPSVLKSAGDTTTQ